MSSLNEECEHFTLICGYYLNTVNFVPLNYPKKKKEEKSWL